MKAVGSSMLLCCVVISLYAMLGTNTLANRYPHAAEYFGSFSLSFVSLLGIATGDSWTFEVRAMMEEDQSNVDTYVVLFFITYIINIGVVGVNVVMAVMMEVRFCNMSALSSCQTVHVPGHSLCDIISVFHVRYAEGGRRGLN